MTDLYCVMSDPIRRSVLKILAAQEHSQSELVEQFSISQPALTKHLKLLKAEGLILERRAGKFCYYRLNSEQLADSYQLLRQEMEQILDHKLHSLKQYAEQVEELD